MYRIRSFRVIYKEDMYYKRALLLIGIFIILLIVSLLFKVYFMLILTLPCMFFAFGFLKKFYINLILTDDTFLYNGSATVKMDAVKEVFIEEGSNLEKKYKVPFKGMEKYKKGKYIVFKLSSGNYVLVKNYDEKYFEHIQKFFKVN
ncbi:MAG: hypothetical protein ACK5LY_05570 [Lachnospirales bacterium]